MKICPDWKTACKTEETNLVLSIQWQIAPVQKVRHKLLCIH